MSKICTSIEQSQKLVEFGLNPSTADMCYPHFIRHGADTYSEIPEIAEDIDYPYEMPCWSLKALLELMPKSICIKKTDYSGYFYFLEWQFANDNSLRYVGHNRKCLIDIYSDHDDNWKDYIDTAFKMMCWLIEQGHIKVNK